MTDRSTSLRGGAVNQSIPKDPHNFKRWADAECVRWPAELTIEAAHAADAWQYQRSDEKIKAFAERYRTWIQTGDSNDAPNP